MTRAPDEKMGEQQAAVPMTAPAALELNAVVTGQGPALVVLHGLFGSAINWRGITRLLADAFEVHALDLRNHGDSPWAERMDYRAMAADVRAYITRHALGKPALLGHSMGGKVAMALALEEPGALSSLIVADIAPVTYADSLSAYVDAMRGIDPSQCGSRSQVQRQLESDLPDPTVAGFLAQNLVSREGTLAWRINLDALALAMPVLRSFPSELRERRFDAPLTVIAGADSDYLEHADGRDFRPMFSNVRIEVVPGAGHWVHADRPQEFVAIVRRALGNTA